MGAAARAQGLLRHGGAAARVSRRPHDVQPGAVAARAARGVRRGPRPRPVSSSSSLKPADAADRRRRRLHPRELLPRAAPADDRRLSALRASCWRDAASCRRRRTRAAARGSRPTTCATCRSGTSWPGSIRSTSTATRASARWSPRAAASPRTTRRLLRDGRARAAEPGHPRVPRRAPRAGRSSSRRRRSTTRSCRCCATRTSTCGRIPTRAMPRAAVPASRGRAPSSSNGPSALPRAAVRRSGRSACGRRKGRCPTRWCRWSRAAGLHVDGDRRADPGADARHRPSRATATATSSSPSGSTRRTSSAPAARRSPACSAITCCRI